MARLPSQGRGVRAPGFLSRCGCPGGQGSNARLRVKSSTLATGKEYCRDEGKSDGRTKNTSVPKSSTTSEPPGMTEARWSITGRALRGCRRGGGPEKPRKERKIGKFFNCAADHRQAKRRELLREKEPGARQERGGAQERTRDSPSPAAGLGAGAWPI